MAVIEKELRVKDSFSEPLTKYVQKLESAESAAQRLDDYTLRMADQMEDAGYEWSDSWFDATDLMRQSLADMNASLEHLAEGGFVDSTAAAEACNETLEDTVDTADRASDKFGNKLFKSLAKVALSFFTMRKIISYFREAAGRAPDEISEKFSKAGQVIKDSFAGITVSFMAGFAGPLERITAILQSDTFQGFLRTLEAMANILGQVVGGAIERVLELLVSLMDMVNDVADIIGVDLSFVGNAIGALYAFFYNIVADVQNAIATLVEFFVNVWRSPAVSVFNLMAGLASSVIGIIADVAEAIGALFGKDWGGEIRALDDRLKSQAEAWYKDEGLYTIERMDKISALDVASQWGGSLSRTSLENANAQNLRSIASDTRSISKAVAGEDLKMLIDMAQRAFVAQVNLTAQTPVITINGANTGDTEADRRALAKAIETILTEQLAAGSTSSPYVYSGV